MIGTTNTIVRLWTEGLDRFENETVGLGVERDEGTLGGVAIHTYIDGAGSMVSFYLSREEAISVARKLLSAVELSEEKP